MERWPLRINDKRINVQPKINTISMRLNIAFLLILTKNKVVKTETGKSK